MLSNYTLITTITYSPLSGEPQPSDIADGEVLQLAFQLSACDTGSSQYPISDLCCVEVLLNHEVNQCRVQYSFTDQLTRSIQTPTPIPNPEVPDAYSSVGIPLVLTRTNVHLRSNYAERRSSSGRCKDERLVDGRIGEVLATCSAYAAGVASCSDLRIDPAMVSTRPPCTADSAEIDPHIAAGHSHRWNSGTACESHGQSIDPESGHSPDMALETFHGSWVLASHAGEAADLNLSRRVNACSTRYFRHPVAGLAAARRKVGN